MVSFDFLPSQLLLPLDKAFILILNINKLTELELFTSLLPY